MRAARVPPTASDDVQLTMTYDEAQVLKSIVGAWDVKESTARYPVERGRHVARQVIESIQAVS